MSEYNNIDPTTIYLLKLNNDTSIVAQCEDLDPFEDVNIFVMPFRVVETFHGTGMKQYLFPWMHGSSENVIAIQSVDVLAITPASENLIRRYLNTMLSYVMYNDVPGATNESESDPDLNFKLGSEESFEQYLQRQNRFNN